MWILILCTQSWGLCGIYREVTYETEAQCYKALDTSVERLGKDAFKYIICAPRKQSNTQLK